MSHSRKWSIRAWTSPSQIAIETAAISSASTVAGTRPAAMSFATALRNA